jgi:hypothetical protein
MPTGDTLGATTPLMRLVRSRLRVFMTTATQEKKKSNSWVNPHR